MELYALMSLALVAGVISFTSPCCLPILPGYVSYVSGLRESTPSAGGAVATRARSRVLTGSVLFVLGFTLVFTVLGITASALGLLLVQNRQIINVVGGTFVVFMGLTMVGVISVPLLQRRFAIDSSRFNRGPAGALPLGAAFAFGWTPCVGPVLTAILATAAGTGTVVRGAALLVVYSLGLGIPFVALAAGMARGKRLPRWLSRNTRRIELAGGVLLIGTGVAMATGSWTLLMSQFLAVYARVGWPPI
ncbi:cytochrome C biogenesis protein [Actinotalea ferrariae CF5-4]|uniref:Cytochrome C biogenesis protein n=1 Tax=Actinotalea ferrariae CF5-4 TaxID=948458 RepID=A0A021VTG6_9CELL|nr:cytochrome c biogenesis protein CcdA [Actinotalea ferrariae]EYR64499.1 cytochrome C biogenesis protein [Actinotalea ferrariae CF5-4]